MKFEMIVRFESGFRLRGESVSDWSKYAAEKFVQRMNSSNINNEKTLSDRKLVEKGSRELWDSLCAALKKEISAFNAEPGIEHGFLSCDNSDPMIAQISRKNLSQAVTITFDPEHTYATIEGHGIQTKEKLKIRVSDGDQLQFFDSQNQSCSVESIVGNVLNRLLEI